MARLAVEGEGRADVEVVAVDHEPARRRRVTRSGPAHRRRNRLRCEPAVLALDEDVVLLAGHPVRDEAGPVCDG